jgi:hypothetical protein
MPSEVMTMTCGVVLCDKGGTGRGGKRQRVEARQRAAQFLGHVFSTNRARRPTPLLLRPGKAHLLIATTLLTPDVGSFKKAKSRCGSHRPVTAPGSNPPTLPARFRPKCNDLRRSVPLKGGEEQVSVERIQNMGEDLAFRPVRNSPYSTAAPRS